MNKAGQIENPVLLFAVIIIGLIIAAPIYLKIFTSFQAPMSSMLGNVSVGGAEAQAAFDATMTPLVTMWDQVMVGLFFGSLLLLLVSAFLVDTHPIWVVLYMLTCMFTIIFAPVIMEAADAIYENANFAQEVSRLVYLDWIRTHYGAIIVGVMVLTGIIMYGKVAFFPSQGGAPR